MNRKWTSEEKTVVVLEMLKGARTIPQICAEYGMNDSLAYRWRDEALAAIKNGFTEKRGQRNISADAEKDRLLKIIGQQTVVIDYQKKISESIYQSSRNGSV